MATKIIQADAQHRAWMQTALYEEVISSFMHKMLCTSLLIYTFAKLTVMCFVSMAMAIGQVFDIPIVLHSLAVSMSLFSESKINLPMSFDLEFVAMLEVGTNENQMDRVVNSYAHDWWNDRTRTKAPKFHEMFTTETVQECLAHHCKQLGADDISIPLQYSNLIPSLTISPSTANTAATGTSRPGGTVHPRATEPDSNCDMYRGLAASLYKEMVGVKNFASIMSVTSSDDMEVVSRRASGFYDLHEKVTLKELTSQPHEVKGLARGSRTKFIHGAAVRAAEDLECFKKMPTSHKWTWGETLT